MVTARSTGARIQEDDGSVREELEGRKRGQVSKGWGVI